MARAIGSNGIDWKKVWPRMKGLLDEGYSAPELEKLTGIKATTINSHCTRIGYKIKKTNRDKIRFDEHDRNLMVLLRLFGLSLDDVAEKFESNYQAVSRITGKRYRMARQRLNGVPISEVAKRNDTTESDVISLTDYVLREYLNGKEKDHQQIELPAFIILPESKAQPMAQANGR